MGPSFRHLAVLVAIATLLPATAAAQAFGQWSWDAYLGIGQRRFDNSYGDADTTRYDQRDLRAGLGLNGFIVHPAIAQFRLGLEGLLSRFNEGSARDSDNWGGRFNLNLLPYGAYPTSLYVGRSQFDYESVLDLDPVHLSATADTSTMWGFRFRARRGFLRGLLAGYDGSTLSFLGIDRTGSDRRAFLDWSGGKKILHHYRLERRDRDYATVDYATEDLTLTVDEHGPLGRGWRWDLTGVGINRSVDTSWSPEQSFTTLRLANRFTQEVGSGRTLLLSHNWQMVSGGTTATAQAHTLNARHTWRKANGWEITPFATFGYQSNDVGQVSAPQAGLSLFWSRPQGVIRTSVSGNGAWGRFHVQQDDLTSSTQLVSYGGAASFAHGSEERLLSQFELGFARNSLSLPGGHDDLPDMGIGLGGMGTEDNGFARLTLAHSWTGGRFSAFAEYRRRAASESSAASADFTADSVLANATLNWATLSLFVNGGRTDIERMGDQQVTFAAATLGWRPFRSLNLRAGYRSDTRSLEYAPDVDVDRIELTADLRIGQIVLAGQFFQTTERPTSGAERVNRGIVWTLGRNFGGWLPFVTGTQRRGTIK